MLVINTYHDYSFLPILLVGGSLHGVMEIDAHKTNPKIIHHDHRILACVLNHRYN